MTYFDHFDEFVCQRADFDVTSGKFIEVQGKLDVGWNKKCVFILIIYFSQTWLKTLGKFLCGSREGKG